MDRRPQKASYYAGDTQQTPLPHVVLDEREKQIFPDQKPELDATPPRVPRGVGHHCESSIQLVHVIDLAVTHILEKIPERSSDELQLASQLLIELTK